MKRTALKRVSTHPANVKLRKAKKKAITITKLNDRLWAATRLLCFRLHGTDCYTCPAKNLTGKNLQGGHVPWPKSTLSKIAAYDYERFIRPQCLTCNIHRGGMGAEALTRMTKEIGEQGIEIMKEFNRLTKGGSYGRQWTIEKIAEYEALLAQEI
ncbi:MAG: hypothetical protein KGL39_46585 [Patescibacteria group bacterium]|nr:hypothetical protein [Patescibacteria group bacterium]